VFDHRPIYGHIRFSFYGITDTRLKPNQDGSALAQLYDETRMARRFFLFENLTLPSLIAQTDPDFRTVIMSSSVMPDRFKDRLSTIATRLPGAVVEFSGHQRGDYAFHKFMAQAAGFKGREASVHFRLDDDDALSTGYVSRLREVTRILSPTTHVTFPTGVHLFPANDIEPTGTSMVHQHFLTAQGLATVNGGSFQKNPFQMMHGTVWTRWPVVSDPRHVAYIRVHHFDNDTVTRQDRVIKGMQQTRTGRRAAQYASLVDRALEQSFPWIDRSTLDGLLARCAAITSLADLPPVG
jgi:Putative rhamnosyl transferase